MKISEALDGLKLDPTRIAVNPRGTIEDQFYPRALFWHPARGKFAIYELEIQSYNRSYSLSEKAEVSINEIASEVWEFSDFNTWYQGEGDRLLKAEQKRNEEYQSKKAAEEKLKTEQAIR